MFIIFLFAFVLVLIHLHFLVYLLFLFILASLESLHISVMHQIRLDKVIELRLVKRNSADVEERLKALPLPVSMQVKHKLLLSKVRLDLVRVRLHAN